MSTKRASLKELIPQERSWLPCACALGTSLALMLRSWLGTAAGFSPFAIVLLLGGIVLGCISLRHMQKRSVLFADRVLSLALAICGLLCTVGLYLPDDALFQGIVLAAGAVFAVLLYVIPSHESPEAGSRESEFDPTLLKKPLYYLVCCAVCFGFAQGVLLFPFAHLIVPPDGLPGYSLGILLAGLVMWALMSYTMPNPGLERVTRSALVFALIGALMLSQNLFPAVALGALALGSGLLLFLITRMALDLHEVFPLSSWMPFGVTLLCFTMQTLGGMAVDFVQVNAGPDAHMVATLAATLLMVVPIVYGLSSQRVWTARELRKSADGCDAAEDEQPIGKRGAWREACDALAERAGLTPREREVFDLLAKGRNSVAIEKKLVISNHTAKTHILNVYRKLDVHSAQDLIDLVEATRKR